MPRPTLNLDAPTRRPDAVTVATVARLLRWAATLLVAAARALDGTGRAARRRRRRGAMIDLAALDAAAHDIDPSTFLNPPGWLPIAAGNAPGAIAGDRSTPTSTTRNHHHVPTRSPGHVARPR